jgi:DinB superfamily
VSDPQTLPALLLGIDDAYHRLSVRLVGLTPAEYLWEPVAGCWSVRPVGDRWVADWADPDPAPAPVTTIAWRMWHVGLQCLASYVSPALGEWPLPVEGRRWFGEVEPAITALQTSYEVFRARIDALGEDGLWRTLGPTWGPYADSTWADLVVHALDELSHHGAEIGLLRDLYPRLS